MSQSIFPTLITSTFIPTLWEFSTGFNREYADLHYVKFPIAQGSQSFPLDLTVTGTTTLGATNLQTKNSVQNSSHYLNFSDSSTTGVGAIQKSANFSVNPSTGTLTASGLVTGAGLTVSGANNITLGDGSVAPGVGQIGYYQTIALLAWPTGANGNITDPTSGTSLPAGTWLISFCLLFGGTFAANNFIYLANPGTEYKTFPIQALTTGATVATVNGMMIQKSTTAYIPNFKVGIANSLTLNNNAYFNATRIA
jgi:hypothetical protein